jgi:hypothetical protein
LLEHLSDLATRLTAVIVTTPQAVALADALKCLTFTRVVNLQVLGVIENMSGFVCPCCGEISNVFSTGGGEDMARRENLTFLGALPVDTELVKLLDHAPADAQIAGSSKSEPSRTDDNATSDPEALPPPETTRNGNGDSSTESVTVSVADGASPLTTSQPKSTFLLSERYQKTSTYTLFKDIAAKVIESLNQRDSMMAST